MKALHLDSEYRNRWQEYVLADGRKFDSRFVNWRQVEWEKVISIVTHIADHVYLTHCKHSDFKFFIVYRWGGLEWKNDVRKQIHQWAVGWTNGENAFLTDIDFFGGNIVRQYVVPVKQIKDHIHPRCADGISLIQ